MRPLIKPALRRLWRSEGVLQLGLDPQRGVVLSGLGEVALRWVERLDGSCDRLAWISGAMADGLTRSEAEQLLQVLDDSGALEDASLPLGPLGDLGPEERDRLGPDVAALSLLGDVRVVMARRRQALVEVRGLGRVGGLVCSLLAAAGVGHVVPTDPLPLRRADTAPGGPLPREAGIARERAVRRAVQRISSTAVLHPTDRQPDLVLLTGDGPSGDASQLVREGVTHLVATVVETTGVVGPLVVPGVTACVRCLDVHRSERDPAWPRLVAQLAAPTGSPAPCDSVLATLVAATAAQQALALIDLGGAELPATANGTLELASPGWRFRRRSWTPHPSCGCGWHQSPPQETMTG